jgi:hypothetical protein
MMFWSVITFALVAINVLIGINDVKIGNTTKRSAFTWFVVGWTIAYILYVEALALL